MSLATPFRADQVGSLLRPAALTGAREKLARGEITPAEFATAQDAEIVKLVAKQEALGFRAQTDGECRRKVWSIDFFEPLLGVETYTIERGGQFKNLASTKRNDVRITGKLGFPQDHPMLSHFRFLRAHAKGVAKMTIPGPAMLHYSRARNALEAGIYPGGDELLSDIIATYKDALKSFYEAGCRYLQFDDVLWAILCSSEHREAAKTRGDDPDRLIETYVKITNEILAGKPGDLCVTTHACRGNFRSSWSASGGYEPVAKALLGDIAYDGYFLEYDTERAGGFEPLRFLPKGGKRVVLGLVTSKHGELESADRIRRRIDEAAKFADLDQLCLSPQCGFASTSEGNEISEDDQWRKLALVVEVADDVWDGR